MKKILLFAFSAFVLATGCKKDAVVTTTENSVSQQQGNPVHLVFGGNQGGLGRIPAGYEVPSCISPIEKTFLAGQSINVGTVTVWNDATNLYVAYQLDGNYQLKTTHMYVGSCSTIPVNGAGNPRIGLYPYQTTHADNTQLYVYVVPLSSLPSGCLCVSSHAEVVAYGTNGSQTFNQTGWAQGEQINDGGSWAMKFGYCIQQCEEQPR